MGLTFRRCSFSIASSRGRARQPAGPDLKLNKHPQIDDDALRLAWGLRPVPIAAYHWTAQLTSIMLSRDQAPCLVHAWGMPSGCRLLPGPVARPGTRLPQRFVDLEEHTSRSWACSASHRVRSYVEKHFLL